MISYSPLCKSTSLQCPSTVVGGICPTLWQWVQPRGLLWSMDVHRYSKRRGLKWVCLLGFALLSLCHHHGNFLKLSCSACWTPPHPRSHHCLGEPTTRWLPDRPGRKTHKSHWNLVAINNWCCTLFYPFLSLLMSLKVDNWLRGSLENFIFFYIDTFPT